MPFTVQAGIPVKWTIRVSDVELNGCNNPVTIPAYGIKKTLVAGDNLRVHAEEDRRDRLHLLDGHDLEPHHVVQDPQRCGAAAVSHGQRRRIGAPVPDGSQGCRISPAGLQGLLGVGGAWLLLRRTSSPAFAGGRVPVDTIRRAGSRECVSQEIDRSPWTIDGYNPAAIVLQKGMKAVIKFKVSQLTSCNNVVDVPGVQRGLDRRKASSRSGAHDHQDFTSSAGWVCSTAT